MLRAQAGELVEQLLGGAPHLVAHRGERGLEIVDPALELGDGVLDLAEAPHRTGDGAQLAGGGHRPIVVPAPATMAQ